MPATPDADVEGGGALPDGSGSQPGADGGNAANTAKDGAADGDASPPSGGEGGQGSPDARDAIANDGTVAQDAGPDGPALDGRAETGPVESGPGPEAGGGPDGGDAGPILGPIIPGPDGGPLRGVDGGVLLGSLIDDFDSEFAPGNVLNQGGRRGTWFTFYDNTAGGIVPLPAPASTPAAIVGAIPSASGVTTNQAAHMTGNGAAQYAGMGFNLNALTVAATYDASAYVGVTFRARIGGTTGSNTVQFNMPDHNTSAAGGVCTACGASFTTALLTVTPAWQQYVVYFTQLSEPSFGMPQELAGVDVAAVYSGQFQMIAGPAFDIWVDDIYFIVK